MQRPVQQFAGDSLGQAVSVLPATSGSDSMPGKEVARPCVVSVVVRAFRRVNEYAESKSHAQTLGPVRTCTPPTRSCTQTSS